MISHQQPLFTEMELIAAECDSCELMVPSGPENTLISACFAKREGLSRYLTLTPSGDLCLSDKPVSVTLGGGMIRCPEGKWRRLI
jgi:hypothetical protein